ncbi:MAG: hypothetical protein A2017_13785 [Lentisphaerae bacterium GWF2_44_16]|nr:MAG: hypothetical protein A2017_13785 [Lentisphaerae bacterium GWF2_44_16]
MKILLIEKEPFTKPAILPQHSHSFWQLDYYGVKKGGVTVYVDERKFSISSNEFILIKPHAEHKTIISEHCLSFAVKFELEPRFSKLLDTGIVPVDGNRDILQYFLSDAILSAEAGTEIIKHALWIFFLKNFKEIFRKKEISSLKNMKLLPVLTYIHNSITKKTDLPSLASMINMSVSHFIKTFRDETGMPPLAYLNSLKIKEAQKLLKYSDMNISMIAFSLKYPDIHSFSRAFKKFCGHSPSEYKKYTRK